MDAESATRQTIVIVDRIASTGRVFVHEVGSDKAGVLGNNMPVQAATSVYPGQRLVADVKDRGDVVVIESARAEAN